MSGRSARASVRLSRGGSDFDRSLSFFDAIYGFAATLLVTNIELPPPEAWSSVGALLAGGLHSQLLAFTLSFVVIAAFWWADVRQIRALNAVNGAVTASSLLTAGLIILLPFTTQGISDPGYHDLPLPTALYALNVAGIAFSQVFTGYVARRQGLVADPVPHRIYIIQVLDALTTPLYFLASVPIAFLVSADVCRTTWLGLIVVGPLSARIAQRACAKEEAT